MRRQSTLDLCQGGRRPLKGFVSFSRSPDEKKLASRALGLRGANRLLTTPSALLIVPLRATFCSFCRMRSALAAFPSSHRICPKTNYLPLLTNNAERHAALIPVR